MQAEGTTSEPEKFLSETVVARVSVFGERFPGFLVEVQRPDLCIARGCYGMETVSLILSLFIK